jgi:hypothetical protein
MTVERKSLLIQQGVSRFSAELNSVLFWMDGVGGDIAVLEDMVSVLLQIVRRQGWTNIAAQELFDEFKFSALLNCEETNFREICEGNHTNLSILASQLHSKAKFVSAARDFILLKNPMLFFRWQ